MLTFIQKNIKIKVGEQTRTDSSASKRGDILSERKKGTVPAGNRKDNGIDEIRGSFEDLYSDMENFSKRAVETLFDDESKETRLEDDAPGSDRVRPVLAYHKEADPDEEYAAYIKTAQKANRIELERTKANREKAIADRDEKLDGISQIPRRRGESAIRNDAGEGDMYVDDGNARLRINVRNIAAVGVFLLLIVFVILTWQMVSARSRLTAANDRIAELEAENADLLYLQMSRDEADDAAGVDYFDGDSEYDYGEGADNLDGDPEYDYGVGTGLTANDAPGVQTNGAPGTHGDLPPNTTINAAGQRVYTVQPGDSLWGIAVMFFGDGGRFLDIYHTNDNITDADNIPHGEDIIIPD